MPATTVAGTFRAITCQLLKLERCSNPLRIRKVFQLRLKIFFILGLFFSVGDIIMGHVFTLLAKFTWPWAQIKQANFLAQFFLETGL